MNQEKNKTVLKKAVFFDRDGVLNKDYGYVYKCEDLHWVNGAVESIRILKDLGYLIIVVTNQSGVPRGFYSENDVKKFHDFMNFQLKKNIGATIDDFFYAFDSPKLDKVKVSRRKPNPAMILEAVEKYKINKDKSFLVGDKETDLLAAKNAGIKAFIFEGKNLLVLIRKILKNKIG